MSTELGFYNYNVFRHDRTNESSSLFRGGGVLIAIRNNIYSKLIEIKINNIELLFVLIKMSNLTFIIGSVYMPIKSNVILFNEYFNTVYYIKIIKMQFSYCLVILIYHQQIF